MRCLVVSVVSAAALAALVAVPPVAGEVVKVDAVEYECPEDWRFYTWADSVITDKPVAFPTDDEELRTLLAAAASAGLVVRMVGATHSIDGLVTNNDDVPTAVVSLACYRPPPGSGWGLSLDTDTGVVTVPAGLSLLDMIAFSFPLGWTPPQQTAGPLFSIAGVIANHVHGGAYDKGFIYEVGFLTFVFKFSNTRTPWPRAYTSLPGILNRY